MIKGITSVVLGCCLAGYFALSFGGPASASSRVETKAPYKIGIVAALTGQYAESLGIPMRQGAALAISQINAQGGIDGHKIVPIYEDSQGDAAQGALVMNKLVSVTHVPYVISNLTNVVSAEAPIANQNHVLLMNAAAQSSSLATAGPYVYTARPYDYVEISAMAQYAAGKLKLKKIALITTDNQQGHDEATHINQYWPRYGGTLVDAEYHPLGTLDFSSYISKILAARPQAVYVGSYGSDVAQIVKQLRAQGFTGRIISYSGFQTVDLISVAGRAANNALFTEPVYFDPAHNKAQKLFLKQFRKAFHADPNAYSLLHYDAVKEIFVGLVKYLLAHHKSVTGANLLYAVHHHGTFHGGVTGSAHFTSDHQALKPETINRVKNGKFVIVKVLSVKSLLKGVK